MAAHGYCRRFACQWFTGRGGSRGCDLRAQGKKAVALKADLGNIFETADLIGQAEAELGPIGVLVNNASVFEDDTALAFDAETFGRHFDLHVRAPAILSASLVQALPEDRSGLIVNIIDQRVLALKPTFFSYTLSKATLWTATQTMARPMPQGFGSMQSAPVRR